MTTPQSKVVNNFTPTAKDIGTYSVQTGGFHRIRHYGLIANNARKENLALARELLQVPPVARSDPEHANAPNVIVRPTFVCAHCGARMVIVETLMRERSIRAPPQILGMP